MDYFAPFISVDVWLTNALFALRSDAGVSIACALTFLASPIAIVLWFGVLSCYLFVKKQWRSAVVLISGLVATEAFTYFAKMLFHRERPSEALRAIVEGSYSFPSGHATSAAFITSMTVYFFLPSLQKNPWQLRSTVIASVLFVLIIDFTRVYLGVHYLSDVIAGNIVGVLGALLTIHVIKTLKR